MSATPANAADTTKPRADPNDRTSQTAVQTIGHHSNGII